MKIIIEEQSPGEEDAIIIRCFRLTPEVSALIAQLKSQFQPIICYDQEKIRQIPPGNILYFEAVDGKVFAYASNVVYNCKHKLYELEEVLVGAGFFRASKSMLVNLRKIDYLSPAFNGRFEAALVNGEKVIVSRQYVPDLKKQLKIKG